jgi:hypothetical protein
MSFNEKIDKLIAEATSKHGQLEAQRKRLLEDRASIEQMLSKTIEEELRVIGELRALGTVKKDAAEIPAAPEQPVVPEQEN